MEENRRIDVNIISCADSVPYITFAFCVLAYVFWANCLGFFGDGAGLAIGMCQLGCYGVYHIGTSRLVDTGNLFTTSIYGIFACVFAGIGGLANVAGALCAQFNIPFDGRVSAISFLLSGILLFIFLPAVIKVAKTDFFVFLGRPSENLK